MFCQNCTKEIPNDSLYCEECGTKQELGSMRGDKRTESDMVKYCVSCKAQIPTDSRFCPKCRTKQDDVSQMPLIQSREKNGKEQQGNSLTSAPLSPEEKERIKKRDKTIGIVIGAAIALCVVIGVLSSIIKPTIDLNKYFSVSFEGYDTVGKAVVTFDRERFESDYEEKMRAISEKNTSGLNDYMSEEAFYESLFEGYDTGSASGRFLSNCVGGSLDKESGLTNGDIVTYAWECNDDYALEIYGYKLKYEDVEYTVSGLEEAKIFDPFDGIDVVFSGISPNGSANIVGEPNEPVALELRYNLDEYDGLSNGDIVTVTATMYYDDPVEYFIENYGMLPSQLSKTFTVMGLDSYIESLSDISDESLNNMQKQAEDVYNAYVAQNWGEGEKLKDFTYIGNYLLTNKDRDDYWNSRNTLYLVYKIKVKNKYSNDDETYNQNNYIYWYIAYYDLLTNLEGVTTVDLTNYRTPSDRFSIDSGVSSGWWSTKSWSYYGYQTLEELYKVVVTSTADLYNHEDNVDENVAASEGIKEMVVEETAGEEGIIFPDSSEKLIRVEDIENLSDEDLRFAVNDLYARHGYIFNDEKLREHYEQFAWYEKIVKPDDFSMDFFNDIEKENIEILQKERDSRN